MVKRTIVYYTDSRLEPGLDELVRKQIKEAAGSIPIISVSQKPIAFGHNICVGLKPRSYLSLYEQVLDGLQEVEDGSIVYLCEHDVFYHPDQFEYLPPNEKLIYFNLNRFYYRRNAKYFLKSIGKRALSQCVAHKAALMAHIEEQVESRSENQPAFCAGPFTNFSTQNPNIDVRHGGNFSASGRFDASDKSPRILEVPYWGTPRMFQSKTGYKDRGIYTYIMLNQKLNATNVESPVAIDEMYRDHLPRLFKTIGARRGAEIGVKRGVFSKQLCEAMPNIELLCVDHYPPTPKHQWDEQVSNYIKAKEALGKYNVRHITKPSDQAADEVAFNSLDFVYIDADHSFDGVMRDILLWTDRVRRGGIVSGHDYELEGTGVKDAVNAYCRHHGLELFLTGKGEGYPDNVRSWFFAKR